MKNMEIIEYFSRTSSYGSWISSKVQSNPSFWATRQRINPLGTCRMNAKSIPASKEKDELLSNDIPKLSVTRIDSAFRQPNFRTDTLQQEDSLPENRVEFGQFLAREAQFDEEYWIAACLRAQSRWEDQEDDRYVDNFKRKFAEQAFIEMKRSRAQVLEEKCTCIVTVKRGEKNFKCSAIDSVVGTLDLSIRYLPPRQKFPGEPIKAPYFCVIDRKGSSQYGYIANLCVAKLARRQGIASSMLQLAIKSAKQQGAEQVFVHVHRHNFAAQKLYLNMGFEVIAAATSQLYADETYLLGREVSYY